LLLLVAVVSLKEGKLLVVTLVFFLQVNVLALTAGARVMGGHYLGLNQLVILLNR